MCNNPAYMQYDAMEYTLDQGNNFFFLLLLVSEKWNKCIEIVENGKINRKAKKNRNSEQKKKMKINNIKGEKEYAKRKAESFFLISCFFFCPLSAWIRIEFIEQNVKKVHFYTVYTIYIILEVYMETRRTATKIENHQHLWWSRFFSQKLFFFILYYLVDVRMNPSRLEWMVFFFIPSLFLPKIVPFQLILIWFLLYLPFLFIHFSCFPYT